MKKLGLALLLLAACGHSTDGEGSEPGTATPGGPGPSGPEHVTPTEPGKPGDPPIVSDPGTKVTTGPSPARQAEAAVLHSKLETVKSLDAAGFAAKYSVPFSTAALGYQPLEAGGYDLIKATTLAPNAAEEAALASDGFVVTDRVRFPSFAYGYQSIYRDDLPVYVSADSILFAIHKSFDAILKAVEHEALFPALKALLDDMRAGLEGGAANDLPEASRRDVDLYLAVASSLLQGKPIAPVAGADAAQIKELYEGASAASGSKTISLFGVARDYDFSQFEPRGHYTDSEALGRYFRATMWFGRTDLRIIETQEDHTQVFRRRQLEAAYVMRAVMNQSAFASWKRIDDAISGFVGEHDNMTLPQLDALLSDLKVAKAADLASLSDETIAQAIAAGNYGGQRISSQIMINGLGAGTMPLSHTFLLLGQRYTLDSHVFSNVVYDRVQRGSVKRMMPNPLDVGFAALKNDQAGALLGEELGKYGYASDLASMRLLADEHPSEYWDANLYGGWMSLLRTLSPSKDVATPTAVGLPEVTGREAWGRRLLSTQLASWAELRHDTILYTKQSYSGGSTCEFPDAYVEPYPELYARLVAFATKGASLTSSLSSPSSAIFGAYFEQLRVVATTLEAMAKNQRTGAAHTPEQLAFINGMVFNSGCGALSYDGWYAKLFYARDEGTEVDSLVADVHTQPTDEAGNTVGKVLHVATWMPRTMIVTVNTCAGARAYVGLVSSYHEKVTNGYERLNDLEWRAQGSATPPEVPWFSDLVKR